MFCLSQEQQGTSDSNQIHFEVILKALVERVHTQLLLCKQIKQLGITIVHQAGLIKGFTPMN